MRPLVVALASSLGSVAVAGHAGGHATAAAGGATVAVTQCSESGVRDAVAGAATGDTIDLTALSACTITLSAGEIVIAVDDLTIEGPANASLTLSGNHASRIFNHTGHGLLTLDHLAMTEGNDARPVYSKYVLYAGTGGAVYTAGSVTLSNSSVTGSSTCNLGGNYSNSTAGYGGGIFANGDVSVIRSTVSGNTACGAVYAFGGVIPFYKGGGGGVLARGDVYVSYSTISGNREYAAGGGGVYGGGSITITHSAITNNVAGRKGGGVTIHGGAPASETPGRMTISASTISGNSAGDGGGLASFYLNPISVYDSTVAFNTAFRPHAAGWFGGGGGICGNGEFRLYSTIVANNTTNNNAPDISLFNSQGSTPASISGNHNVVMVSSPAPPPDTIATDPGLLPLADNGGPSETHALAPNSVAINAGRPAAGLFFDQRGTGFPRTIGAAADIGAFESGTPPPPVSQCSDPAVRTAFAAAADGGIVDLSSLSHCTITLVDGALTPNVDNIAVLGPHDRTLVFDGNHQDRIILHGGSGVLKLDHVNVTNGYVDSGNYSGGAVFSYGSIVLASSSVTHSVAGGPRANTESFGGGGIFAFYSVVLDESVVSNNASHSRAGGIIAVDGDVTIRNSTISNNQSDLEGGGVWAPGCFVVCAVGQYTTKIENSTISGNSAGTSGGGVQVTYPDVVVRNSTVTDNDAVTGGGGLFVQNIVIGVELAPAITIVSSIVAGNAGGGAADIGGLASLAVGGDHDIINAVNGTPPPGTLVGDPGLLPLADNGGPTPTHALAANSIAIDHGSNPGHLVSDQRGAGYPRFFGQAPDIGAYERSIVDRIFANGFN